MSKGLLDSLLGSIFDADWIGRRGESLTARELKWVNLFGRKGKTLRNVYLPTRDNGTTEIDVLYITQKGIFVIESKNYSGWIFGDEGSAQWTAMLPNREKHCFYNPVKQNRSHIKWLHSYLRDDVPLFSLIVFSERCELKKVTVESANTYVIKRDALFAAIRHVWNTSEDVLTDEKINSIYEILSKLTRVDNATKTSHVEHIQERYQNNANCPYCGGRLILRTAKKGGNAGNQFYGCSNYPKCRYTRGLDSN